MIILSETIEVNFISLSKILKYMNIDKLHLFSIDKSNSKEVFTINEGGCNIDFLEIGIENFIHYLNPPVLDFDFRDYNKNSLYILRNGSYIDIKNLFTLIQNNTVNLGRGGSQKSHMISPLDYRLSAYLMAICKLDYKLFSSLNTFNYVEKYRYLPFK